MADKVPEQERLAVLDFARAAYGTDDVEIDDNAVVVKSDYEDYWVAAWVFVLGADLPQVPALAEPTR